MRIRTVKPEFWRSDDIDALCLEDRLLFIGLWSYVDDSGVGIDKESSIAADLFAGDLAREFSETSRRVHEGLKRLSAAGLITRYTVSGRRYLHIATWTKHQKINRPTPSRYPPPASADSPPPDPGREPSLNGHGVLSESSRPGTGEQGNRGTGENNTRAPRSLSAPVADATPLAALAEPPVGFAEFYAAYPRKKDRRKAEQAWKAALKRGADPAAIVRVARVLGEQYRGRDTTYVKYPASWLNADAYHDEPEQPALRLVSSGATPFSNPADQSVYDEPMFPIQETS